MADTWCPYCGQKNPGDPCSNCGAGRQVPTARTRMEYNDYIDRLKQDLATPGKLSPAETVAVRGELVSALNAKGAQLNTGHQVQAAPAPSR